MDKPADLVVRGLNPSGIINTEMWLCGLECLSKPESVWSVERFPTEAAADVELEKKVHAPTTFGEALDVDERN